MKKLFALIVLSSGIFCSAQKPDYSREACWLRLDKNPQKAFDVFYVYPTTYMNDKDGMNASLDNEEANKGAESAYQRQATAFKKYAISMRRATGRHQ